MEREDPAQHNYLHPFRVTGKLSALMELPGPPQNGALNDIDVVLIGAQFVLCILPFSRSWAGALEIFCLFCRVHFCGFGTSNPAKLIGFPWVTPLGMGTQGPKVHLTEVPSSWKSSQNNPQTLQSGFIVVIAITVGSSSWKGDQGLLGTLWSLP